MFSEQEGLDDALAPPGERVSYNLDEPVQETTAEPESASLEKKDAAASKKEKKKLKKKKRRRAAKMQEAEREDRPPVVVEDVDIE